jgi:hypothetical protein
MDVFLRKSLQRLAEVLREARTLLAHPDNDFLWSSWDDSTEALAEIDAYLAVLDAGELPPQLALVLLFAPTGCMQEVSLSGWSVEFLRLSQKFDEAYRLAYAQ